MSDTSQGWSEENSRSFIETAKYFVPYRQEQIDTIVGLVPDPGEPFQVLELACGDGVLAQVLLERYPQCCLRGLDGSDAMLQAAHERLAPIWPALPRRKV